MAITALWNIPSAYGFVCLETTHSGTVPNNIIKDCADICNDSGLYCIERTGIVELAIPCAINNCSYEATSGYTLECKCSATMGSCNDTSLPDLTPGICTDESGSYPDSCGQHYNAYHCKDGYCELQSYNGCPNLYVSITPSSINPNVLGTSFIVIDFDGNPVPSANIALSGGYVGNCITDVNGKCAINVSALLTVDVTVSKSGYKTFNTTIPLTTLFISASPSSIPSDSITQVWFTVSESVGGGLSSALVTVSGAISVAPNISCVTDIAGKCALNIRATSNVTATASLAGYNDGSIVITIGSSSGCDNDNIIDSGEQCDGTAPTGKTCADFGFTGGILTCVNCNFNTSGCTGGGCAANGCGGGCPAGCTVAQDPDCGCQGGNNCCPSTCNSANDTDCSSVSPPVCTTGGLVPCGRNCDDLSTTEIDESEPCGVCAGFYMLRKTIDFVLPLAVEAAIFFLIVAGLLYAFSGGDVRKAGMARSATTGAIYGLVFAFLAWLIISASLHIMGYINFGDWNHTSCVLPTKIIYTEATVPVNCNGPVPNFHNDDCVYFTDAKIYKSDSEKNLPDTVKVELGPNVFNQYGNMEILSPKGDVIATLKSSNSENMDCTRNTSPCPPAGDVNSDGLVNDVDVAWIADYLAGLRMFLVPQFTAADADGNGNVNAVDERLIKDYIAGETSTFPVCASGRYSSIPECPHSSSSGYYDAYFTPNLSCGFYLNCPVTIEANAMLDVLNSSPPPNYFTVADDACWRLYDPMLIMRYSKDFTGNDSTAVPSFTANMTGIWNINLYKGRCASLSSSSVAQCYNAQYYAPPNPLYNGAKGAIPGQDITSLFNDGPGIYTVRVNAFSNCKNSARSAAADLNVTIAHRL